MPPPAPLEAALDDHGMLLVQGQREIPSVADLLAGEPVTTRGYSHDYVPAWEASWELAQKEHVAEIRLFRGQRTLVHERYWTAVNALAMHAQECVRAGHGKRCRAELLAAIVDRPGITGDQLKAELGVQTKDFQRRKNDLLRWLCIVGFDQPQEAAHTHDQAWHPWEDGKIGRSCADRTLLEPGEALHALMMGRTGKPATLFPVARFVGVDPIER